MAVTAGDVMKEMRKELEDYFLSTVGDTPETRKDFQDCWNKEIIPKVAEIAVKTAKERNAKADGFESKPQQMVGETTGCFRYGPGSGF